jgi:hypothetical protein
VALVDIVALLLAIGSAIAFFLGNAALARAEDLPALYWLIVGAIAVRSAVHLARPGAER